MRLFNGQILILSVCFGLLLGATDAFFDWMYHYEGEDAYPIYLVTVFEKHELVWRGTFLVQALIVGLLVSYYYNLRKSALLILDNVFDNIVPICITNSDYEIIMANNNYYRIFGVPEKNGNPTKCYEHRPGPKCHTDECPVHKILKQGKEEHICESTKVEPNKRSRTFIVSAAPYRDQSGRQRGIIECFQDITEREELEEEKAKLIDKLNSALAEVKKLSSFLPICSSCKKVRDDKGYWKQIETRYNGTFRYRNQPQYLSGMRS